MTTMKNVSSTETTTTMTTLDKIWKKATKKNDDVVMEDTEKKEANQSNNHSPQTTKNKYNANADDGDYTPLFPMTLRFKLIADTIEEAHKKHMETLKSINDNCSHCEVFSKSSDPLDLEKGILNFDYHQLGNRQKLFVTVHRIVLDIKYHEIKKKQQILNTLKNNKCFLNNHEWAIHEWDIVAIGFISGASPRHQSKETITHKYELVNTTNLKYRLHARYLKASINDNHLSTHAYEIQCQRKDMNEVISYIHSVSKELDQTFILFQWKYANSDVFTNGINKQNSFLENIRTIPVYGIVPEAMGIMRKKMINQKFILDIGATAKTTELGRWNAYTTFQSFGETTKWIQNNITKLYEDCNLDLNEVPPSFTPEVRFGTTITFEKAPIDKSLLREAEQSVKCYTNNSPTTKTWASVAKGSNVTSTITPPSEITKTIERLSTSIDRICDRLDLIEQRLSAQEQATKQSTNFQEEVNSNLERISSILLQLEERTNTMTPKRLESSYDQYVPNKRQDVRKTPTKTHQRL